MTIALQGGASSTSARRIRVFVCDDSDDLRALLKLRLADEAEIDIIGEADNAVEAVEQIAGLQPDVVLLDVSMPRTDGLDAIEEMLRLVPGLRVVVWSGMGADAGARALARGAHGFIDKKADGPQVAAAIRTAVDAQAAPPLQPAATPAATESESHNGEDTGRWSPEAGGKALSLRPSLTALDVWPRWAVFLLTGILFVAVFASCTAVGPEADGRALPALMVFPVAAAAMRFGRSGGLFAAAFGIGLLLLTWPVSNVTPTALSMSSSAATLIIVAAWLGRTGQRIRAELMARAQLAADLRYLTLATSHDLAEPVHSISGFAELLQRHVAPASSEREASYLSHILSGSRRMEEMIDDLLSYARAGEMVLDRSEIDLNVVLAQAVSTVSLLSDQLGADIECAELPRVWGDANQLTRVFQNLLGNALKFGPRRGRPRIRVDAQREQDAWRISVHDNGIGIDPQEAGRIFGMFERLQSESEHAGTGVGLALCARIVERHGGRIWVEPAEGSGSTFSFTLPDR